MDLVRKHNFVWLLCDIVEKFSKFDNEFVIAVNENINLVLLTTRYSDDELGPILMTLLDKIQNHSVDEHLLKLIAEYEEILSGISYGQSENHPNRLEIAGLIPEIIEFLNFNIRKYAELINTDEGKNLLISQITKNRCTALQANIPQLDVPVSLTVKSIREIIECFEYLKHLVRFRVCGKYEIGQKELLRFILDRILESLPEEDMRIRARNSFFNVEVLNLESIPCNDLIHNMLINSIITNNSCSCEISYLCCLFPKKYLIPVKYNVPVVESLYGRSQFLFESFNPRDTAIFLDNFYKNHSEYTEVIGITNNESNGFLYMPFFRFKIYMINKEHNQSLIPAARMFRIFNQALDIFRDYLIDINDIEIVVNIYRGIIKTISLNHDKRCDRVLEMCEILINILFKDSVKEIKESTRKSLLYLEYRKDYKNVIYFRKEIHILFKALRFNEKNCPLVIEKSKINPSVLLCLTMYSLNE